MAGLASAELMLFCLGFQIAFLLMPNEGERLVHRGTVAAVGPSTLTESRRIFHDNQ